MPSAAPGPRVPSALLLGSAVQLLRRPGCPACRHAAEAADAYLSWFALEGHGDVDMLARLRASAGMCAVHTRRLLSQPGAAVRMTTVGRHLVTAVANDLFSARAGCPACEHDEAAAERVAGLLLDDVLAGHECAYRRHGGLCLPHLRAAVRHRRRDARWLVGLMVARLAQASPVDLLAGGPDPDERARAWYRSALPDRLTPDHGWACAVCWAAAGAERAELARVPQFRLCGQHLRDAVLAGPDGAGLLTRQAGMERANLVLVLDGGPWLPRLWSGSRARRALADPDCPVCGRRQEAVVQAAARLRAGGLPPGLGVCARHVRLLPSADTAAIQRARSYASGLLAELDDAARKHTWTHRDEARGQEMTAWRRAAAFLDGAVFGGCPVN